VIQRECVEIGIVASLHRYPVKSMQGTSVDRSHVWWYGLDGDRRYAFLKAGNTSGFPWLTARDVPEMLLYAPYFTDPDQLNKAPVRVLTPDGRDVALESDELLAELAGRYGKPVALTHIGRGAFDSLAVSLLSLSTLRSSGERLGQDVDPQRFRANIVIETYDEQPHQEDGWLGDLLVFGDRADSAQVRINRRIPRCMMVNLDPATSGQNPRILRDIAQTRDNCTGVYGSTEETGTIEVGDRIRLMKQVARNQLR
jgi:uncharacterized protein YcbX